MSPNSKSSPDSFLPPAGKPLFDRARSSSVSGSLLRGSVLLFEPEDRERFSRALGVLRAGDLRELSPSAA